MSEKPSTNDIRVAASSWESLFRAQVAVMRRIQRGKEFHELALREYDVLFTLSSCPSGWLRLNELNDHVLLSQSSLSRLVERLETRGLVERTTAPEDGRGVLLRLTPEGSELQKRIGRGHVQTIAEVMLPALTREEMKQLEVLTDKLRAGVVANS
ncbi:MarR family winged helix-turn-helix transcriptional regulator [Pseudarthrobacter sp. J1738]|uniref:MarR family winged helix-turn-helix transcriptional regulator n=1 Tax=Pseudarthrobacter sp. J1738 TaxID=3420446 RepID=UPI003D2E91A8